MTFVSITGYEPHPLDETRLWNRWIDVPAAGTVSQAYSFRIEGWLLLKYLRPARTEIRLGEISIAFSKTFVERPDVKDYFNTISDASALGFSCKVDTLLFPAEFEMQIVVVFEDDSETSLGVVKGSRRSPAETVIPKLQPFKVYGLARSGTTLMMRYLLNHPQIIAHNRYPYEVNMMAYFTQVMGVLTSRADHKRSAHPDTMTFDPYHVGYNPYYEPVFYGDTIADWFNTSHIEEVAAFCKRSLDNFYLSLAQAQGKTGVCLFAEKDVFNFRGGYQWLWYPESRGILLVRDFRDRHCSILSFNKKRGFNSFGYESAETQESFARNTLHTFNMYYEYLRRYPAQILVVRYEDLLLNPRETVVKIFAHGGLDTSDTVVDRVLETTHQDDLELAQHRTTESGKSIGRWKKDLDPDIAKLYADLMGDIMAELGYEV
jgi:hypothetical protein